jgi:hypothetical protein
MYTFVKTQKRPTADTLFFFEYSNYPDGYVDYIKRNYIETGKLLSSQKTLSADNESVEFITKWRSREDFLSYVTDETIYSFIALGNDYDIDNNIESVVTVTRDNT